MHWNLKDHPSHYLEEQNITFQWLPNTFATVQEYNWWVGNPGPKKLTNITRTRAVVFMQTHHEAILKLNELFKEGDLRALRALYQCHISAMGQLTTLGYDFFHNCPTVTAHFQETMAT